MTRSPATIAYLDHIADLEAAGASLRDEDRRFIEQLDHTFTPVVQSGLEVRPKSSTQFAHDSGPKLTYYLGHALDLVDSDTPRAIAAVSVWWGHWHGDLTPTLMIGTYIILEPNTWDHAPHPQNAYADLAGLRSLAGPGTPAVDVAPPSATAPGALRVTSLDAQTVTRTAAIAALTEHIKFAERLVAHLEAKDTVTWLGRRIALAVPDAHQALHLGAGELDRDRLEGGAASAGVQRVDSDEDRVWGLYVSASDDRMNLHLEHDDDSRGKTARWKARVDAVDGVVGLKRKPKEDDGDCTTWRLLGRKTCQKAHKANDATHVETAIFDALAAGHRALRALD